MPEGYHHLTYDRTLPDLRPHAKRPRARAAIARQLGVHRSTTQANELDRNIGGEELSLQTGAGEGVRKNEKQPRVRHAR